MRQTSARPDAAKVSEEVTSRPLVLVDGERGTGSPRASTDPARETSLAPPRLIPVPDSPPHSVQVPTYFSWGEGGMASASDDRNCAPSQVLEPDIANHDQLSFGQLHELCEQMGYREKDTKVVLRTRLAAMDAADRNTTEGSSSDMNTSMSVLGKRTRTRGETMDTCAAAGGSVETRPRSDAPEIDLAADSEVVKGRAQW